MASKLCRSPQAEVRQTELHESSTGFLSVSLTFQSLLLFQSRSHQLFPCYISPYHLQRCTFPDLSLCDSIFWQLLLSTDVWLCITVCSPRICFSFLYLPFHVNFFPGSPPIIPQLSVGDRCPSPLCHPFTLTPIPCLSFLSFPFLLLSPCLSRSWSVYSCACVCVSSCVTDWFSLRWFWWKGDHVFGWRSREVTGNTPPVVHWQHVRQTSLNQNHWVCQLHISSSWHTSHHSSLWEYIIARLWFSYLEQSDNAHNYLQYILFHLFKCGNCGSGVQLPLKTVSFIRFCTFTGNNKCQQWCSLSFSLISPMIWVKSLKTITFDLSYYIACLFLTCKF